jgi:peroxiredoxin
LKSEYDKNNIGLVAISADTIEDSKEFVEDKGITVPLLADTELNVIKAYGVAMEGEDIAVPATFILTKGKTIYWKYIGENMTDRPSEEEVLEMAIAAGKE